MNDCEYRTIPLQNFHSGFPFLLFESSSLADFLLPDLMRSRLVYKFIDRKKKNNPGYVMGSLLCILGDNLGSHASQACHHAWLMISLRESLLLILHSLSITLWRKDESPTRHWIISLTTFHSEVLMLLTNLVHWKSMLIKLAVMLCRTGICWGCSHSLCNIVLKRMTLCGL